MFQVGNTGAITREYGFDDSGVLLYSLILDLLSASVTCCIDVFSQKLRSLVWGQESCPMLALSSDHAGG